MTLQDISTLFQVTARTRRRTDAFSEGGLSRKPKAHALGMPLTLPGGHTSRCRPDLSDIW